MQFAAPTIILLFVLCSWEASAYGVTLESKTKVKVSPVQKVVQLIDEMAAKVQKELDEETHNFEEYAKFCDDEMVEKSHAIQDGKEAIEELDATAEEASGDIDAAVAHIEDVSTKFSDTESELSTALELRTKEKEAFEKTEHQMLETIRELSGATETLKKSLALVQLRGSHVGQPEREALGAVVAGLGQLVEASFVTTRQRQQIQALLEERVDAEETFEARAHTLDSNGIVNTLTAMTEKAEESLNEARKREADQQHSHAMLKQGLEQELNGMKQELAEATAGKASNAEKLAAAQGQLVLTTKAFEEDTAYLKDVKNNCRVRSRDFETTVKDNKEELEALGKARAILQTKFALVQTGATSRAHALAKAHALEDQDPKARALRSIERLGRKLHSTALVALAYRAASDPFGKIRSMVEDMIAKLMHEAAEEATQKAFCDTEIDESTRSKEDRNGKLDEVNTRLEKAAATVATLTEAVSALTEEVAESDAEMAQASALRQKENGAFLAISKELSESEEACLAAAEVLREYYEGASLIQVRQKAKAKAQDGRDASGILGVLEVAGSDFARNLAEAENVEKASAAEFAKLADEAKMLKATKSKDIKGKQSEIKSLKVSMADLGTDKESLTRELDAVLAYLDKLKPQCEVKVPSYAERKATREQEIEGLKDALKIIEG